jgi:hypothetical protein
MDKDICIAVDVSGPRDPLAVGRELAAVDFPFVLG